MAEFVDGTAFDPAPAARTSEPPPPARHAPHRADDVVVLSASERTLDLVAHALADAGIRAVRCTSVDAACELLAADVGALVLDAEMLADAGCLPLIERLRRQPAWSDIQVIVLLPPRDGEGVGEGEAGRGPSPYLARLAAAASVTVLERPLTQRTLASVAFAALRARHRQFEIRDSIEQLGHAETALQRTRERLDLVAGAIDLGIWFADLPLRELVWSEAVRRHFGLPAGARVTIETFYKRLHPDDREPVRAAFERAIAHASGYDIVFRTVATPSDPEKGRVRWIRAIGHVFLRADGTPARLDGITLDVTAERTAIEAARASERRYRALVEASAQIVWSTLADGQVEDMPQWRALTGQSRDEIRGLGWLRAIHAEDGARVAEEWLGAVSARSIFDTEFRIRLADGRHRWYHARGVPVGGDDGAIREWVGICIDVDELKGIEADQRFLLELADTVSAVREPRELIGTAMRRLCDYLELARASLAEVDVERGVGILHPGFAVGGSVESGTFELARFDAMYRALKAGEVFVVSDATRDERVALDGEETRFLPELRAMVCIPLHRHGRWIAMLSAVSDAPRRWTGRDMAVLRSAAERIWPAFETARALANAEAAQRAAEVAAERTRRLQALAAALSSALTPAQVAQAVLRHGIPALEARSGVVFLPDPDGASLRLLAEVGLAPAVLQDGKVVVPIDAPIPIADVARRRETIFLSGRAAWRERYPAIAELADAHGWLALAACPVEIGDRLLGVLAYDFGRERDFGDDDQAALDAIRRLCAQALERARLFEDEREARKAAVTASRAKSDFLAVMSHELRTPLNAIAGHVQLVEMGIHGPVTDAQRDALVRVQRSQQHLLALIDNLLNFARVEAGRVEYALGDIALAKVVAEATHFFAPLLEAKGLGHRCLDPDPGLVVRADPDKLLQIVLNLVTNAIKFTPSGGEVVVELQAGERAGAPGMALLRVRDTGPGIPAEMRDAIFEPFVQVGRSLTRPSEGVGLGLAISRELARGMAGELTVESEPGAGATFTLALPRVPLD